MTMFFSKIFCGILLRDMPCMSWKIWQKIDTNVFGYIFMYFGFFSLGLKTWLSHLRFNKLRWTGIMIFISKPTNVEFLSKKMLVGWHTSSTWSQQGGFRELMIHELNRKLVPHLWCVLLGLGLHLRNPWHITIRQYRFNTTEQSNTHDEFFLFSQINFFPFFYPLWSIDHREIL